MKWITKNYRGDEQIWYSGDVIEDIISVCIKNEIINNNNMKDNFVNTIENSLALKIMQIIENEDK